jgi:signal transduction histidine kinase
VGCRRGIYRIHKDDLASLAAGNLARLNPLLFDKSEGLTSLDCAGGFQPTACRAPSSQLWFPTARGAVLINPASLTQSAPPEIILEQALFDGVPAPGLPLIASSAPSALVQPSRTRTIAFEFTSPNLTAPEKMRFRYKLEGLDRDWIDAGALRWARYPQLPAGHYTFTVIACNHDGVWNNNGVSLGFEVRPPLWQTWWFIGLAILMGSGAVAGVVRLITARRLRRKLARLQQQHAVEKERTRIARDMHDDVGAKLTRVRFLCEIIKRGTVVDPAAEKDLDRLSLTAQDALKGFDEIVWAVNPKNDTLDNLINYLIRHTQEFFESTSIQCQLDIPSEFPALPLSTEVRHNLFLAYKEALNNVARHSGATIIKITIALHDQLLTLQIQDNGNGFLRSSSPPKSTRTGSGLDNMRERLQSLGGTFRIASQPGEGVTVNLEVPMKSDK